MRNGLTAASVVHAAAASIGLADDAIAEIFAGASSDFPLHITRHLPLFADRFGMVGITLFGSVWLVESLRHAPAVELIALIRHEAEHVRQQREHPLSFYLRYAWGYVSALVVGPERRTGSRFRDAYLAIPYEREAYEAGARARRIATQRA